MAPGRPSAPPELAAALATFDQFAAGHIARARAPVAAWHPVTARSPRPGRSPACLASIRHHYPLSHPGPIIKDVASKVR
jgi:hypothetical protein